MTSLPQRIAKLLEFDEDKYRDKMRPANADTFTEDMVVGALQDRARTAPLDAALVKAVEALEFYREQSNWSVDLNKKYSTIMADGGMRSKQALAEIESVVKKMEGE